jgi:hypothetical protein
VTRVGGFAACQVEGDDITGGVRFRVDFRGEAATRPPERLPLSPPFAPAADICARAIVESNVWIRCADELIEASASKEASKTPALLNLFEAFPYAVPRTKAFPQGAPSNILDREEEMKGFEEAASSAFRPRRAGRRETPQAYASDPHRSFSSTCAPAPDSVGVLIQLRNPKNLTSRKFVHTA